ncbi:MAG: hypothetical protein ACRDVK_00955 [Acidimicrobiia bacterium]
MKKGRHMKRRKTVRFALVTLGWILALSIASVPVALIQEYGFESVGWGLVAICFVPITLMVVGLVRRKSPSNG